MSAWLRMTQGNALGNVDMWGVGRPWRGKRIYNHHVSKKCANFEPMDKGKIDSVFEDLKNKKMLKKDGSFYMGDSVAGTIEAILLALFFLAVFGFGISCLWILDGWRKILGMMLFSPFLPFVSVGSLGAACSSILV